MLIDLKAHYVAQLVGVLEASQLACLHRPDPAGSDSKGVIYVTPSESSTRSEIVMGYDFGVDKVTFAAQFRDSRKPFTWSGAYQDGLDEFWPAFRKAMDANRIEHKRKEGIGTS